MLSRPQRRPLSALGLAETKGTGCLDDCPRLCISSDDSEGDVRAEMSVDEESLDGFGERFLIFS